MRLNNTLRKFEIYFSKSIYIKERDLGLFFCGLRILDDAGEILVRNPRQLENPEMFSESFFTLCRIFYICNVNQLNKEYEKVQIKNNFY